MATRKTPIQVSHEDIVWIKHKISEMDISLTRIQQCVIGDAEYGQIGLVKQVEEHQAYVEKDKAYKSKVAGGMVVVGGLWTFVLKFWDKLFQCLESENVNIRQIQVHSYEDSQEWQHLDAGGANGA